MDVNIYLSKEKVNSEGIIGQKYEVIVYPVPPDHERIAKLIRSIIKDALE